MTRDAERRSQHRILVVDDSRTVVTTLSLMLKRDGHDVKMAMSGDEAIERARDWQPHCILLDYYLPDMTGEDVLQAIRTFDRQTQIVLVTAHSNQRPAREMMQRLDIQGYHDKGDGFERLMVWVDAALKAYDRVSAIQAHSEAMSRILGLGRRIHKIQPINELLTAALEELAMLLAKSHDGAVDPGAGGVALIERRPGDAVVRAVFGRAVALTHSQHLNEEAAALYQRALAAESVIVAPPLIAIPIQHADKPLGGILYNCPPWHVESARLRILAQQVAIAISNNRLYEMATVDSLTGLASRSHLMTRLVEWLKFSVRANQPLSLIYLDLDGLKSVNDSYGHLAGDELLSQVGKRILATLRTSDVAGRYGGDEILIVTPNTPCDDAGRIADRLCKRIRSLTFFFQDERRNASASVGFGGFNPLPHLAWMNDTSSDYAWEELSKVLIDWVDEAAYVAKNRGGGQIHGAGDAGQLTVLIHEVAEALEASPTTDVRAKALSIRESHLNLLKLVDDAQENDDDALDDSSESEGAM